MFEGFIRRHWVDLLALWLLLFLAGLGANAYYARKASLASEANNQILRERPFGELLHAVKGARDEHAELMKRCGP